MKVEATVPISLVEDNEPVYCNIIFFYSKTGNIQILAVQKPVSEDPLVYADIDVSTKILNYIESYLYDNWVEY